MKFFFNIVYFIVFLSINVLQSSDLRIDDNETKVSTSINSNIKNLFEIAYISEEHLNLMNFSSKTVLDSMSYDLISFPTVKDLIDRIKNIHGAIAIFVVPNLELKAIFRGMWNVESKCISIDRDEIISNIYPETLMFELCNASNPFILLGTAKKFSLNEDHYAFFSEAIEHISLKTSNQIFKEYLQYCQRFFLPNTKSYDLIQDDIEDISHDTFANHWQKLELTNFKHIQHYKTQFKKELGTNIFPSLSKINDNDCQFLITTALSELSLDLAKKESKILKI